MGFNPFTQGLNLAHIFKLPLAVLNSTGIEFRRGEWTWTGKDIPIYKASRWDAQPPACGLDLASSTMSFGLQDSPWVRKFSGGGVVHAKFLDLWGAFSLECWTGFLILVCEVGCRFCPSHIRALQGPILVWRTRRGWCQAPGTQGQERAVLDPRVLVWHLG